MCPLNNLSTLSELVQSLKSSGARAVVTNLENLAIDGEAAKIVGIPDERIVLIDEVEQGHGYRHFSSVRSRALDLTRPVIDPGEDLAFLVYSSGTTGLPKGVMLTHRNITANIVQNAVLGDGFSHWSRDRSLGFLPMFHIYGMFRRRTRDKI